MKKIQQSALFLLFIGLAAGIFITSLARTQSLHIAQSIGVAEPSPASSLYYQKLQDVPQHSQYQLASPGILPTHPLYGFKMVRDRILLTLTPSARQSPLLLLYGDKRLAAAEILVDQGKVDKAVTVATKGMSYFRQALESEPVFTPDLHPQLLASLTQSSQKYEDILNKLAGVAEFSAHDQVIRLQENLYTYQKHLHSITGFPSTPSNPEDSLQPRI